MQQHRSKGFLSSAAAQLRRVRSVEAFVRKNRRHPADRNASDEVPARLGSAEAACVGLAGGMKHFGDAIEYTTASVKSRGQNIGEANLKMIEVLERVRETLVLRAASETEDCDSEGYDFEIDKMIALFEADMKRVGASARTAGLHAQQLENAQRH